MHRYIFACFLKLFKKALLKAEKLKPCGSVLLNSLYSTRFYWLINIGALIAYSVVAYVQQDIGFAIGYSIPLLSMTLAVVLFVIPTKSYIHKPPEGWSLPTSPFYSLIKSVYVLDFISYAVLILMVMLSRVRRSLSLH